MSKWALRGGLPLLLVALLCWRPWRASAAVEPPEPSVLLFSIDTLRPDALGKGDSPAIDAFLRTATRYAGARTVVPLTVPAHATALSGLAPSSHGLHDNATALLPSRRRFPLLAEEFKKAGYATAAFVSAMVLRRHTGLADGFDVYDSADQYPPPGYLPAEQRVPRVVEWLDARRPGTPWFLFVHLYDPHEPHTEFPGAAGRPAGTGYRGEVRRADLAFERILAHVPAGAIVVLMSDHGESLGEHGESTHGPLCYGSTIDSVLALRVPGGAGAVDTDPRSLCDIAPTLRELCGLPARKTDGRLLTQPARGPVISESLQSFRMHGWGQCFAAFDGRYSLVEHGPTVELFDRETDPGERMPIPLDHPAYETLDRALRAYRAASTGDAPEYIPSAASPYGTGRRPQSGYLDRRENRQLVDPRTRLAYWDKLNRHRALTAMAGARGDRGLLRGAIEEMRRAIEEDPDDPAARHRLADALYAMGYADRDPHWFQEASSAAREAVARGYWCSPVVQLALDTAFEGKREDDLRASLALVESDHFIPDFDCMRSALRVALYLSVRGDTKAMPRAEALLRRATTYHPKADVDRLRAMYN